MKFGEVTAPVRGRKCRVSDEVANKIYNFWKENSHIRVDRRNNRNVAKVYPEKINKLIHNIPDENVKLFQTERGREKLKGHRHIYTKTSRMLYKMFTLTSGEDISCSTSILKPALHISRSFKQNLKKSTGIIFIY